MDITKFTPTLAVTNKVSVMLSTELAFLNIGTSEMMLIIVVALLIFGGKKLPELARGLGRGIREFKDASESVKRDISDQINNFEKDLEVKDVIVDDTAPKKLNQDNTAAATAPVGTYQHNPSPDDYYGSDGYSDDYSFDGEPSNKESSNSPSSPHTTTDTQPEDNSDTPSPSENSVDSPGPSPSDPINEEKNA